VAAPVVLLAGGFCAAAVAFWSVLLVEPVADCDPLPTVLEGVWLVTGAVAVELVAELGGADIALLSGVVVVAVLLAGGF